MINLSSKFFKGSLLLGLGVYFIIQQLVTERPVSTDDLIELKCSIKNYSFKDKKGFRNFTHEYYIYTNEYPNSFQIKADYLQFFNRSNFENDYKKGNEVILSIPRFQEDLIGNDEIVMITSLNMNSTEWISKHDVIELEQKSKSDYKLGIIFFSAGLIFILFYDKIKSAVNEYK